MKWTRASPSVSRGGTLRTGIAALCVICCAAVLAPPAAARIGNRVFGSVDVFAVAGGKLFNFNIERFDRTLPGPQSDGINSVFSNDAGGGNVFRREGDVFSAADAGYARTQTYANLRNYATGSSKSDFTRLDAEGLAESTLYDVVVSGAPGTMVTTSLNARLTGNRDCQSARNLGTSVSSSASVSVRVWVNGRVVGEGYNQSGSENGNPVTSVGSGFLEAYTGDKVVSTQVFTVEANKPFSVSLELDSLTNAALTSDSDGVASALGDFSHTFTFATDRPVFNLPNGVTVNSVSGGIVDNRFSGVVAVPESASWLFFLPGAGLGVGLLARRGVARK